MLLSPPLAHPAPDNSRSVSLCLHWREPCTSPQPGHTLNLLLYFFGRSASVHFSPTSYFASFFCNSACMTPYFSFLPGLISPCLHALFSFSVPIHTFPWIFYSTITHSPVRSIYLCMAESFSSHRTPLYATVMESSPLSSLSSFISSSSPALSLPELLLTFCLLTHFKFN